MALEEQSGASGSQSVKRGVGFLGCSCISGRTDVLLCERKQSLAAPGKKSECVVEETVEVHSCMLP